MPAKTRSHHVEDLKGAGAKHVQRGEHPAAARLVLMGHGLSGLERDAVGVLVDADGALVARCSGDAHRRHGVTGDPIGTAACEPVGERIDASLVDRAPWHEVRQRYAIGRTIHTINLFINLTCTFLQRAMHIMDVLYQFTIRRAARAFRTGIPIYPSETLYRNKAAHMNSHPSPHASHRYTQDCRCIPLRAPEFSICDGAAWPPIRRRHGVCFVVRFAQP